MLLLLSRRLLRTWTRALDHNYGHSVPNHVATQPQSFIDRAKVGFLENPRMAFK